MRRGRPLIATAVGVAVSGLVLALAAGLAGADSFTPVTLQIAVTPIARRAAPLRVTVHVTADAGTLDTGQGPMRVEVKLAPECGADFQHTTGVTLLNAPLNPQPATGRAYTGSATGSGRPTAYGPGTVCTYVEDTEVGRVYANDESTEVTVTQACTAAGSRYDAAHRRLLAAQRALRRAHGRAARKRAAATVSRRRRAQTAAGRSGRAACGPGVPL